MDYNRTSGNNNHQLKKTVALLLLLSACFGIAPSFFNVVTDTERTIGIWSEKVYILLNNNEALNFPICLCLIFLAIKLLVIMMRSTIRNYHLDYHRILNYTLSLLLAIVFIKQADSVNSANMFRGLDLEYKQFVFELLGLLLFILWLVVLIAEVVFIVIERNGPLFRRNGKRIIKKKWWQNINLLLLELGINLRYELAIEGSKGFSAEGDYKIKNSPDLLEYGKSIADRLMHTRLSKESFAVGIISKWGAGKTTFLELLRKELNNKADVVEFNPWMCSTPEQVTNDFFASLHNQLVDYYPELSNPIKQYAKYLTSVSLRFPGLTFRFSSLFSEKGLSERKKDLSDKFEKLGTKVVVIIDDVDRLESSEFFEVLRLIRNTADLKNVIYLVAFDKDYVVSILKEKNIDDPISYLEKIFQVEIQLPLVPPERIMSTLFTELNLKIASEVGGRAKPDFQFDPKEQDLILKVITTYRRAKRFARLYTLNYAHLLRASFVDLEWKDLFWLDLLQMNDKNTYDLILCNNPTGVLKTKKRNGETYYIYEDSDDNKASFRKNPYTHEVLLKLFGDLGEQDLPKYSIRNTNYYEKYFTMQVQFSKENLETLLNTDNINIDALIEEWREKHKPIDNIAAIVHQYDEKQLDKDKVIKLVNACFSILYYYDSYNHSVSVDNVLGVIKGKALMTHEELEEQLISYFNKRIEESCDLTKLACITEALWYRTDWKAIATVSVDIIFDAYFKTHTNCTVLELKKDNTVVYSILNELPVGIEDYAVNCLIDGYSNTFTKPTKKQFREILPEVSSAFSSFRYRDIFQKKNQRIVDNCCSDGKNVTKKEKKKWMKKIIPIFAKLINNKHNIDNTNKRV